MNKAGPIRPIRVGKEAYEEYTCLHNRVVITDVIDRELTRRVKAYYSDFLFRTAEDNGYNTAEIEALCEKFNKYIDPVVTKLVKDLWDFSYEICDINRLNLINSFIVVALSVGLVWRDVPETCYDNLCKHLVAMSTGHVKLSVEREKVIFNEVRVTPYE